MLSLSSFSFLTAFTAEVFRLKLVLIAKRLTSSL